MALVMVLSMLPMNVFGEDTFTSLRVQNAGTIVPGGTRTIQLQVPVEALVNTTGVGIELRINTHDDHANGFFTIPEGATGPADWLPVGTVTLSPGSGANAALAGWLSANGNVNASLVRTPGTWDGTAVARATEIRFDLPGTAGVSSIPTDASGFVLINVQANILYDNTNLQWGRLTTIATNGAVSEHGRWSDVRLTVPSTTPYVTITRQGDPSIFGADESYVQLPHIRITEGRAGQFNDAGFGFIRLEAPRGYHWVSGPDRTANHAGHVGSFNPVGAGWAVGGLNASVAAVRPERIDNVERHVIYIAVTGATPLSGHTAPLAFEIRGLRLQPDLDNARLGELDIIVTTLQNQLSALLDSNQSRPGNDGALQRTETLTVANRVNSGLSLSVVEDEIPELRTGFLNLDEVEDWMATDSGRFIASPPTNGAQQAGLQTAAIEIRELAPGAWGNSLSGARLTFTFEQDGVSIIGAAARAGRNDNRRNIFPDHDTRANYAWQGGWMDIDQLSGRPQNTVRAGNVTITENDVTVQLPYVANVNQLITDVRVLQVVFWISVVGGFEAANPGEDIYVTVSGNGATGLPVNNRTVAVATPVDPFSVRMVTGVTEINTDLVGDTVSNRSISNIEITILEPHLLSTQAGSNQLSLTISGAGADQGLGLLMSANRNATVNGTGLRLSQGNFGALGGFGTTVSNTLTFTILSVPDEDENDGPVTIVISDVLVSGAVIPGVEYSVVLHGNGIAANVVAGGGNVLVGRFVARPYSALAVTNARDEGGATRPAGEVVISIHDRLPGVDQEPITFRTIAGQNVGLVSMRAFAYLIGGEAVPNYPTTGDWTINGVSVAGEVVQITVNDNSPSVRVLINGVLSPETDLSRWAGPLTGVPHGQLPVLNLNGNVFLPFRAMANIFGYDVEMVTSFSIRFFS